jgi:UDP-2-acetamido-3-amino-2,3-dideoxy-glucuronate N-acetyltransferase
MKKNIAVVGCGYWGKNLVRNFSELGALYSVSDVNIETAKNYANQYQVKYLKFDEIINDINIKGIVLTVPAKYHASMAIEAMKKGKHIFVEKPLALNEIDAKLMVETSKKNNVKFMVGHLLHYHPIFKEIKKIVNDGQIGKLEYIQSSRLSFGRYRSEEDIIWSFAPHDISMILKLANEKPNIIRCNTKSIIKENHADIANISMEFPSGLKSNVSVSWINPNKEVKLVLTGNLAMLIFDDTKPWDKKLSLYSYDIKRTDNLININKSSLKFIEMPEEEPLKNECKHFIDVIKLNTQPLTDGNEGLEVVEVLSLASKFENKNSRTEHE